MIFPPELLRRYDILDWGYTEESQALSFDRFKRWSDSHGDHPLIYLKDHRQAQREDLKKYFPGLQSAFVFLFDYAATKLTLEREKTPFKMGSYALAYGGEDYHRVLGRALQELATFLARERPTLKYALALDTAPVLDRDLAYRAGLGWFGKNSMLIHPREGSYFLIGSLLTNQTFSILPRPREMDHCGTCTACVSACPTDAIDPHTRTLKPHQCISTFTIELFKPAPPPSHYLASQGEVFGCDICQEVCPWNMKKQKSLSPRPLGPKAQQLKSFFLTRKASQVLDDLEMLSNREFKRMFKDTSLARTGRQGLMKNFTPFAQENACEEN